MWGTIEAVFSFIGGLLGTIIEVINAIISFLLSLVNLLKTIVTFLPDNLTIVTFGGITIIAALMTYKLFRKG